MKPLFFFEELAICAIWSLPPLLHLYKMLRDYRSEKETIDFAKNIKKGRGEK